jgi:hypothetical protein
VDPAFRPGNATPKTFGRGSNAAADAARQTERDDKPQVRTEKYALQIADQRAYEKLG